MLTANLVCYLIVYLDGDINRLCGGVDGEVEGRVLCAVWHPVLGHHSAAVLSRQRLEHGSGLKGQFFSEKKMIWFPHQILAEGIRSLIKGIKSADLLAHLVGHGQDVLSSGELGQRHQNL